MSTTDTITGVYNKEIFDKAMHEVRTEEHWRCAYLDAADRFYVHVELTGHQYYGSPYESCDSCGTCDGARCDGCKVVWILEERVGDSDELREFATVITKEFDETDQVLKVWKEHCEENNIPW